MGRAAAAGDNANANYCVAVAWDRVTGRANPYVAEGDETGNIVCRSNLKNERAIVLKQQGNWRLVQFKEEGSEPGCRGQRTYWIYGAALRRTGESIDKCRRPGQTEAASCGANCTNPEGLTAVVQKIETAVEDVVDTVRSITRPSEMQKDFMNAEEKQQIESGLYGRLASYPTQSWVKDMIQVARANASRCLEDSCRKGRSKRTPGRGKRPEQVSVGHCYRYVKYALIGAGVVEKKSAWPAKNRYEMVYAKSAGKSLERLGFKNIKSEGIDAKKAPKGAILVYDGGSKYGHVEIKTGENEFTSDYIDDQPVSIKGRYRLIGVYIKE